MADLIDLPVRRRLRRSGSTYQIQQFAPDGSVLSTRLIVAHSDTDAKQQSSDMADGLRVELRSNGRLVAHFGPPDGPVATSLRLLDDRPAGEP